MADPDMLVDLTTAATAFEAELIVGSLRARDIPAQAFTIAASMLQWDIAASQPFRVAVRRADLQRAQSALLDARADSVDIDWEELDPGPPTDAPDTRTQINAAILWRILWIGMGVLLLIGVLVSRLRNSPP